MRRGTEPMSQLRHARSLATVAGVAAVYFLAARFGLSLAFVNASASPVWPPTGIALAALLVLGYRAWPGVWLGAFLANLATSGALGTSLGIATGNTLECVIGAWLVHRFASGPRLFDRPRDVFTFAVFAGLVGTAI